MRDDDVICLTTASNLQEAHWWRVALEEEGVRCRVVGDDLTATMWASCRTSTPKSGSTGASSPGQGDPGNPPEGHGQARRGRGLSQFAVARPCGPSIP